MSTPKTALITGANRGIGLETAHQLAQRGWQVIATSRTPLSPEARTQLTDTTPNIHFQTLDVTDPTSITEAATHLQAQLDHLDLLINNAGILLDWNDSILDVSAEVLSQTHRTNTIGPILVTRAFRPLLQRAQNPLVINVSSAAGSLAEMRDWAPAYGQSKAALNAATIQLNDALKPDDIAVCSVSPGWVRTDMGGPNATRSLEEGAASIANLTDQTPSDLAGRFLRDTEDIPW